MLPTKPLPLADGKAVVAARFPVLAPSGLHCGGQQCLTFVIALKNTFEEAACLILETLKVDIPKLRGGVLSDLEKADVNFLFNGNMRPCGETLQEALDEAEAEHGPEALAQPLADFPSVSMVLSVIITNGKLPKAALTPRVPQEMVKPMVRAGKLRFTSPTGEARKPGKDPDPCPICMEEMGGMDGCKLPCEHPVHSDCIARWMNEGATTCPVCRYDVTGRSKRQKTTNSLA